MASAMTTSAGVSPGEPIRRTVADREADARQAQRSLLDEKYREWPNEAGFDGLKEERGPVEINVEGTIPSWAAGSLYRTGPGQFQLDTVKGPYTISHWFDGLAHTHRFDIVPESGGDVRVFYSSRRQSEALAKEIRQQRRHPIYSFGQRADPCMGLFAKFMAAFHSAMPDSSRVSTENICVTVQGDPPGLPSHEADKAPVPAEGCSRPSPVQKHGHRGATPSAVWLASDTASYRQVDPATLEPIGLATQTAWHPDLKGPMSCAHVQRDPETGDLFNYNLNFGRFAEYRIFRVDGTSGKTEILALIQRPDVAPAYMHSFFLSPSFVILCVPSSHLAMRGAKVVWERNVLDAMVPFDERNECKWLVVDRHHGRGVVAEFKTPAGFFFHAVNSFEERDEQDRRDGTVSVFCDVVQYPNTDVMRALYYETLTQKNGAAEKFWGDERHASSAAPVQVRRRVRVPFGATGSQGPSTLHPETVVTIPTPHCGELPTINPGRALKRHRFVYGVAHRGLSTMMDTLVKTDMDTGEAVWWNGPAAHTPGEAIFIARPGARDDGDGEDDGVLLSVVLDGPAGVSYLLCLDARTMREIGRAEIGFAVGLGFHGLHSQP